MQLKGSLKSMDLKQLKSINQIMCKILFPAWEQTDNVIYIARSLESADNKSLHTIFENQGRTNIQFCPTQFLKGEPHYDRLYRSITSLRMDMPSGEEMMKQLIIARRDLDMSPGKLAAQVAHASSAFLIEMIRDSWPEKAQGFYHVNYRLDEDIYDNWINDGVTKVVCGAHNKSKLEKAIEKAKELGMIEGVDYFPIVDACRTELTPETPQGILTCVGFRPMEAEKIDEIGKDFHLY